MLKQVQVSDLNDILKAKREHLDERKARTPMEAVRALASMQSRPLPILNTITDDGQILGIGQIRHHTPATGDQPDPNYDPVAQTVRYAQRQLDAVALFTDDIVYLDGLDDLMLVARAVRDVPVISQDYIVDEYQVVEARAAGASAVMLHADLLKREDLRLLVSATQRNRMTAMVKVTDASELNYTLGLHPHVIALGTPVGDRQLPPPKLVKSLLSQLPSSVRVMIDGAFKSIQDVVAASQMGMSAIVVDEKLLVNDDLVRQLKLILRHGSNNAGGDKQTDEPT